MIKNIVFFVESPLSKRDFDRFGIQILRNEGFDVNIWYFKPYSLNRFHSIPEIQDLVHDDRLQIFERKSDVLKCISVLKDSDLVVCLLSFDYHNLFVYQALSRKRSWYCVWQAVSLPVSINTDIPSGFFFRKILKKIGEMKIRTIHYHFMTNLLKKHYRLLGVRPASIALLAGQRSDDVHFYPIGVNTKKIWLHLLDYDIYLKYREEGPDLTLGRYAVFLDEYIPFHPDYQSMGVEPPASADEYYPKLCTFFEFIEKKFDLRVIVAAHPRSNYDLTKKYFGDRQVIKGKTAQLVKDSVFVIAHASTSVDFAVLFKKPLMFITTAAISCQQMGLYPYGGYICTMAAAFRKVPVTIDNMGSVDWNKEMTVDDAIYQEYQNAYIKKNGTPELPFWKIFADYIRKM